ncbi:MAG: Ubiquitin fusion degradation protein 4 [Piccolia ochrophora]|nr:MAG: Ubiquitin fusion degradation protein 4 [Piccolia ochrophora]
MSRRITRSAARQAAESVNPAASQATTPSPVGHPVLSRKRKAAAQEETADPSDQLKNLPSRRAKRQKVTAETEERLLPLPITSPPDRGRRSRVSQAMSETGTSAEQSKSTASDTADRPSSAPRKSGRNPSIPAAGPPTRRNKKAAVPAEPDVSMSDERETPEDSVEDDQVHRGEASGTDDDGDEGIARRFAREDDDDPFTSGFLGGPGGPPTGLSTTLRALSGMVTGMSSRLRDILNELRQKDDPSVQLIALGELSQLLLVSNEDNLSGHFAPDQFVKELVALMQPAEFGEENQEMMLMACRGIYNLMEALPAATANVVYGGAVPVLCQKLLEIQYIDLAEQAISTLEKISVEFPSAIVREGGLTACLTYLDFFATGTQRSAVTTAANCCRNIPEDSFPVVRDVMPIILNVLGSSDQKVVEQGCLCVSRVVDSFRYRQDKVEALVSTDLLKAVLRLLLPGTTTLIGPNIHTKFLRVLALTARASPKLSAALFKMNIVDTLYQILTGVSPPDRNDNAASDIDSVVIMQALIHRPREQVFETLNVICELLPGLPEDTNMQLLESFDITLSDTEPLMTLTRSQRHSPNEARNDLLMGCQEELKRFAVILLPTLTDAYSSTVNLGVRQKVLIAQLKMLSNLDTSILEEALRPVPYASHLASILSQQDDPTLVAISLQAAELLLKRLEGIYRYQFHREGVIAEIEKIAATPIPKDLEVSKENDKSERGEGTSPSPKSPSEPQSPRGEGEADIEEDPGEDPSDIEEEELDEVHDDVTASPVSSQGSSASGRNAPIASGLRNIQGRLAILAKRFLELHEDKQAAKKYHATASGILQDLRQLAESLRRCYLGDGTGNGAELFSRLARYFDGDALESITSFELLNSGVVEMLLGIFSVDEGRRRDEARATFLEVFMGRVMRNAPKTVSSKSPVTPFGALVNKLQDLLSRAEHFEVVTVHSGGTEGNRSNSPASMLAKQIRLRLLNEDDDQKIPPSYRSFMVSIHAIATFKSLDDYLRPKISFAERPRGIRHREGGVTSALAAFAAAAGLPQRLSNRATPPVGTSSSLAPPQGVSAPRGHRKPSRAKPPNSVPAAQSTSTSQDKAQEKTPGPRRSTRTRQAQNQPLHSPVQDTLESQDTIECADERQLDGNEDQTMEGTEPLDTIVDDLEDEMDDDSLPDPSAVNMEVAATGKVTARKEDGTRVATPSQAAGSSSGTPPSSRPAAAQASTPLSTASARHMSYAAAMQSIPQDWHIEFSIAESHIPNETTIYRAVQQSKQQHEDVAARNVWQSIHTIKYKRAPGPPPPESNSFNLPPVNAEETSSSGLPLSLDKNPATSAILRLLNILHALNINLDDVLVEDKATLKLNAEPLTQFVNTKLTAKLNRQLEEPLIVASNCLPSWSDDLARLYPFLFPFETRHLFLQSTSFGYSRSMTRWQNSQSSNDSRQSRHRDDRPFLGRLQRQKVRISRTRILESAVKVMELYGSSSSVLEVEYFEEVGTGLGPTLEFYSTVSKEFSKKKLRMWRETESTDAEFAFGRRGLFPAPMSPAEVSSENGRKLLHLFTTLGKFVARSMLDSRIIDVSFNPTFFRIGDGQVTVSPSLGAVKAVDEGLAMSLKVLKQFATAKQKIDDDTRLPYQDKLRLARQVVVQGVSVADLGLDFTLPGYPSIELQPNGANLAVNIDNVGFYIDRVIDLTLGSGVQPQIDAFRLGFSSVFPYKALKAFTPNELVMLFGRVDEDWSLETLMDSIKADHGFNMDSKSVRNLLQAMSELSPPDRREFLQFVTGSPKLPIGGFKSLTPMFTVVCKPSEPPYSSDDYLPSVMTCVNYLKLPDYSNLDVMRERLDVAMKEGQGAFHLS